MRYSFVVAHPDDEVLGLGAFIYDSIRKGDSVDVVILNGANIKSRPDMEGDIKKSHDILGIQSSAVFDYENLTLGFKSSAEIVPLLEKRFLQFRPDYVFTHWKGDIHPDHKAVHDFVQQAVRITQRHLSEWDIKGLYCIEVPSSTNWGEQLVPNKFFSVSSEGVDKKIEALKVYKNVVRDAPHPRSEDAVRALSIVRGSSVGVHYAEGVVVEWEITK